MCLDSVSAVRALEVAVFVCLRSSCNHVTGRRAASFLRLELKAVMQNDGDFVNVILLYTTQTGPLHVRLSL